MHVLVFQVHGLSAVLPLCYLCNSEVICGIVHLQPAAPFRLSHAGPVAHREILFHLPPLWCQSAAHLSPAGCSPSPSWCTKGEPKLYGSLHRFPQSPSTYCPGTCCESLGAACEKISPYLRSHVFWWLWAIEIHAWLIEVLTSRN